MHTNAYRGEGGSEHDQKYAFCTQVKKYVRYQKDTQGKVSSKKLIQ